MDLVNEQHSGTAVDETLTGRLDNRAYLFHPGVESTERFEVTIGGGRNQASDRSFTCAGWAVENHRTIPAPLDEPTQGGSLA